MDHSIVNPSDRVKELVERLLEHRQQTGPSRDDGFRELVEIFYRPLHRFFGKRGVGKEQAHDLTQETFVRIYRSMDTYRREAGFETWLFSIAGNVSRQYFRDRQALKRGAGQQPQSLEPGMEVTDPGVEDPLRRVIREQRLDGLRRAMDSLPAKMRAVVKLSVYQERSRQEIALALGISPETVKAHLHQAKKRLAQVLAEEPEFGGGENHD